MKKGAADPAKVERVVKAMTEHERRQAEHIAGLEAEAQVHRRRLSGTSELKFSVYPGAA